jgi:hypothetical protein
METLTPQQIENWRRMIFIQLEQKLPGAGTYAVIMPEEEVISYWKKMKSVLEQPEIPVVDIPKPQKAHRKPKCDHSNSITGQNGTYCLDCEHYV